MAKKIRLAVCISGTGRTLNNLIRRIEDGSLSAVIGVVISSSAQAEGLQYAEENNIPIEIIEPTEELGKSGFSAAIFKVCRDAYVDYVILAGFVKHLELPQDFYNRVLNIHPSLIPAFCGKSHYGNIVHARVLESGVKVSGCTVHFVDDGYDTGPILLQKAVEVLDTDTPDSLNDRVFAAECEAYPEAISILAEDRATVKGRIVHIAPRKRAVAAEDDI